MPRTVANVYPSPCSPGRARSLWRSCLAFVTLAALALLLMSSAVADAASRQPVKVMTRNLYLGADLTRSIAATTTSELLAANAQIFTNVQQTDFPARAQALAREIEDADPDLIGLQEVATWSSGPFNDPAPATNVEYDFLDLLQSALAARGLTYDLVKDQAEADLEAPAGSPYFKDFRLQMHDAILVKRDSTSEGGGNLVLSNEEASNFTNNLTLTTGTGQQITVKRGWVSVDATLGGRSFRFVDTHLEAFHPGVRAQQAGELVAGSGPVGSAPGRVILVGDMNSDPNQSSPNNIAYNVLIGAGLTDTWLVAKPRDPGLTCCFTELLDDPSPTGVFGSRIDHVLTKGNFAVRTSKVFGTKQGDRTPSGLWPSDHAGVRAILSP